MTPKASDYGHRKADKELTALIRRLHLSYRSARIGLQEKLEKYFKQFEKEDAKMRALYDSGELSHKDYLSWRYRKIAGTKQWKDMLSQLANDMVHQNQIAASMINDILPGVYAENHNYGTYEAESGSGVDTTYTLYDKDTVSRLLKGTPDLLPAPSVKIAKDKQWNRQQIQSALLQGLLQGESMRGIANRFNELTPSKTVDDIRDAYKMTADQIAKAIARKNAIAAMRNARTSVTGAENAGRIDSYKRAQGMGIKMKQQWMATLDGRTRDSHVVLDGETQEVGKKFSNGCRYPGDPSGPGEEVYNCRCTVVAIVAGADPYDPHLRESAYLKEQGLTYEEWKEKHGASTDDAFDISKVDFSPAGQRLLNQFARENVSYKPVEKLKKPLSEEEIINRLAGGDMTRGSCVSLAYAYAGNKCGLDVLDFRGGNSLDIFSRNEVNEVQLKNMLGFVNVEKGSSIRPAKALLAKVMSGKEYVLSTGRHAAIVRKTEEGVLQYLELQSAYNNGWKNFEVVREFEWGTYKRTISDTLKDRFACNRPSLGISYLMDISCFENDDELRALLGYLNTDPDKQKKGASGSEK